MRNACGISKEYLEEYLRNTEGTPEEYLRNTWRNTKGGIPAECIRNA